MSKKKKDDTEEVEEAIGENTCVKCKHYQEPDNQHAQTTWCDHPKSHRFDLYTFKGDSCKEFKSNRKSKADGGKDL